MSASSSLTQKYERFSKLDESAAVTETEAVRASEQAVKDKEREAWRSKQALAADVRAKWARGELTDAEYARLAREAGVSAREVLAELKERLAQRRPVIDTAAVSRGDVAAVSDAAGVSVDGASSAREASLLLSAAEERKAVATALLQRAHHAQALEGLSSALATLTTLPEPAASSARARNLRCACLGNSALAHLGLKAWAEAEAACDGVLALEPRNVKALMRRSAARHGLGRLDAAIADLESARAIEPQNGAIGTQLRELGAAARKAQADSEAGALPPPAPVPGAPLARSYCYLDVSIDGQAAGRLVLQLFDEIAPLTCANFHALCKGWTPLAPAPAPKAEGEAAPAAEAEAAPAAAPAPQLCYRGSPLHRIAKGLAVQGGDILKGDGSGAVSIYGGHTFADETFAVPHARPGVLSMANMGEPHTNGCQFFITTNAAPHLDKKHVAFGRVLRGMAVLHRLEALPLLPGTEAPAVDVRISECGVLDGATVSLDADDDDGVSSYGADALVVAAARGDSSMVRVLTRAGAEANARVAVPLAFRGDETVEGLAAAAAAAAARGLSAERTALHVASANGHSAVVAGLLAAGADGDAFDSIGFAPLHLAVREARCPECVRALLDGGADVGALTAAGLTAAHIAADHGDEACLAALLAGPAAAAAAAAPDAAAARADSAERRARQLALVSAATPEPAEGAPEAADDAERAVLVPSGAPAGGESAAVAAGIGGVTPLHVAAAGDRVRCVALLLRHGARPQARAGGELSAVHIAAARGALGALGALLAHAGADDDATARAETENAAAGAAACSAEARAAALANAEGGKSGKRPVHSASEHGAADAVRMLVERGADLHARDARGSSALHWASMGGHLRCVQTLLALGADVGGRSARGASALHVACEHGKADVARALLAAGADASACAKGGVTPLHAAAKSGCAECVRALLAAGAQADVEMEIKVDSSGHKTATRKRALHVAAEDGHAAVLSLLIAAGADVNSLSTIESEQSTSAMSALFAARRGKHAEAAAILEAAGAVEISRVDM